VTILDANLLLYAYNESAPEQVAAAEWLTKLLESGETIALPWVSIWAFLRISTNARIFPNARSAKEAFAIVSEWLAQPGVVLLQPGPRHFEILERLALRYAVNGPLLADAVLAALAVENGAVLASSDQDFRRFPEVRWMNPLAEV
jgi:toxin-antitoxin system PIN domain toxin